MKRDAGGLAPSQHNAVARIVVGNPYKLNVSVCDFCTGRDDHAGF